MGNQGETQWALHVHASCWTLKTPFLVAKVTSGLKTSVGTDNLRNLAMLGPYRALIQFWALQLSAGSFSHLPWLWPSLMVKVTGLILFCPHRQWCWVQYVCHKFSSCLSLPPPVLSTGLTGATLPALSIPTWMAPIGASLRIRTSSGPMDWPLTMQDIECTGWMPNIMSLRGLTLMDAIGRLLLAKVSNRLSPGNALCNKDHRVAQCWYEFERLAPASVLVSCSFTVEWILSPRRDGVCYPVISGCIKSTLREVIHLWGPNIRRTWNYWSKSRGGPQS